MLDRRQDRRHETGDKMWDRRHETEACDRRQKMWDRRHETEMWDRRRETWDVRQETWNRKHETGDVRQRTWDRGHETWDVRKQTLGHRRRMGTVDWEETAEFNRFFPIDRGKTARAARNWTHLAPQIDTTIFALAILSILLLCIRHLDVWQEMVIWSHVWKM